MLMDVRLTSLSVHRFSLNPSSTSSQWKAKASPA